MIVYGASGIHKPAIDLKKRDQSQAIEQANEDEGQQHKIIPLASCLYLALQPEL